MPLRPRGHSQKMFLHRHPSKLYPLPVPPVLDVGRGSPVGLSLLMTAMENGRRPHIWTHRRRSRTGISSWCLSVLPCMPGSLRPTALPGAGTGLGTHRGALCGCSHTGCGCWSTRRARRPWGWHCCEASSHARPQPGAEAGARPQERHAWVQPRP